MTYQQITTIEADVESLDHAVTDPDTAAKINRVVGHCRQLLAECQHLKRQNRLLDPPPQHCADLLQRLLALEQWRRQTELQLSGYSL